MTWHFWKIFLEVYGVLALIATFGITLGGYMWNRVREDEPEIEDDSEDWALYAERTR